MFFFPLLIDPVVNQNNGTATAVSEDQTLYEPVLKKCKEEEDEHDIDFKTEQESSFTQSNDICMDDIKVVVIGEADTEPASTSTSTASREETTVGKCEDTFSVILEESSSTTMVSKFGLLALFDHAGVQISLSCRQSAFKSKFASSC